jgi:hypothetical protein
MMKNQRKWLIHLQQSKEIEITVKSQELAKLSGWRQILWEDDQDASVFP